MSVLIILGTIGFMMLSVILMAYDADKERWNNKNKNHRNGRK